MASGKGFGSKGFNRKRIIPALAAAGAIAASAGYGYWAGKKIGRDQIAHLQTERNKLIRALNAPPSKATTQRSFDAMGTFEAENDLNGLKDYLRSRAAVHVKKARELAQRRRWSNADVLAAHQTASAIGELLPPVSRLREDELHVALGAAHGALTTRLGALGRLER